jgi:hypothetical protein
MMMTTASTTTTAASVVVAAAPTATTTRRTVVSVGNARFCSARFSCSPRQMSGQYQTLGHGRRFLSPSYRLFLQCQANWLYILSIGPPRWCVNWWMYVYLAVSYTDQATCKHILSTSWGYKTEPVRKNRKLLVCSSLVMAQYIYKKWLVSRNWQPYKHTFTLYCCWAATDSVLK